MVVVSSSSRLFFFFFSKQSRRRHRKRERFSIRLTSSSSYAKAAFYSKTLNEHVVKPSLDTKP